jgi:hypothetical protein
MRQLQLKRFDIIFKNHDTALANLKKYEDSYVDGEIMAAAFYNDDSKTADNIAYIIGIYVKKDNKKKLFTIDVKDIESHIEDVKTFIKQNLQYASSIDLVSATTYNAETTDKYKVDMQNADDKFFRLYFTPVSKDSEKVSVSIGDIKAGMTAGELRGYTLSRLIDAMLFKTIYPTILNGPYATISKPTGNDTEVEVGTEISNVNAFNLTYTPGQARVKMESGDLPITADTGSETSRSIKYKFNNGTVTDFGSSLRLDYGTYSFTGTVNYAQGEILHDSKGNSGDTTGIQVFTSTTATSTTKCANPHAAGSVVATTSVATYYKPGANTGTNSSDISDIVKLNVKGKKGMIIDFKIKEIVDDNGKVVAGGAYQIAVPHDIWNGVKGKIMKYNAASDTFNADDTANWTMTSEALTLTDAAGNTYKCDLLEHNVGSMGNDGTGNARVAFQIN